MSQIDDEDLDDHDLEDLSYEDVIKDISKNCGLSCLSCGYYEPNCVAGIMCRGAKLANERNPTSSVQKFCGVFAMPTHIFHNNLTKQAIY